MKRAIVSGGFDDLKFQDFRFLEEAAKLGSLHVLLWSDAAVRGATGDAPKFPLVEREYFVQAIKFVDGITVVDHALPDTLPEADLPRPDVWVVPEAGDTPGRREWTRANGVEFRVIPDSFTTTAPKGPRAPDNPQSSGKKVVVTGCFDWFHTGHVRFFEEVSELGELYVVVGNDDNLRLLKGEGHPLFPALERRYLADSIRYVKQALISSGMGWMDAEPEFTKIKPDIYAVNEDGDKPEKLAFCQKHGIEYRVLKRLPKAGLPRRQSTDLRGF